MVVIGGFCIASKNVLWLFFLTITIACLTTETSTIINALKVIVVKINFKVIN